MGEQHRHATEAIGMWRLIIVLASIFQLAGCAGTAAFNRAEDYRSVWPAFDGYSSSIISVTVFDQRPYVISGDKGRDFVGLMRAQFGNPFDIATTSTLPLARDIEEAVASGLQHSGVEANTASQLERQSLKAMTPNHRLLVITMMEWKTDTYIRTRFMYDVRADIYDHNGVRIGCERIHGSRAVASGTEAARESLTTLLATEPVAAAITANYDDTLPFARLNESAQSKPYNPSVRLKKCTW